MSKKQIKIGQKVFIITRDLEIKEQTIEAILKERDKIKYKLNVTHCNGIPEEEMFLTKGKAEKAKHDFLDKLRFKLGDMVAFKSQWDDNIKRIGRITEITKSKTPYEITKSYGNCETVSVESVLLKVKNDFIESYENIQELFRQFEEKQGELKDINRLIQNLHTKLEKELQMNVQKMYSFWNWKNTKIKFSDRFIYGDEAEYYEE